MAPVDIEKDFKGLKGRKMQPSAQAWQKLEAELDEQLPAGRRKSSYPWGYAAAAAVFLLFAALWFWNRPGQQSQELPIVEQEIQPQTPELPLQPEFDFTPVEETAEIAEIEEKLPEVLNEDMQQEKAPELMEKSLSIPVVSPVEEAIALAVEEIETQLIAEGTLTSITDAEVDSLLRAAQLKIFQQRQDPQPAEVDAMALLQQAETELDQSFREKVFEKLKLGFDKVRTAVADRNN